MLSFHRRLSQRWLYGSKITDYNSKKKSGILGDRDREEDDEVYALRQKVLQPMVMLIMPTA